MTNHAGQTQETVLCGVNLCGKDGKIRTLRGKSACFMTQKCVLWHPERAPLAVRKGIFSGLICRLYAKKGHVRLHKYGTGGYNKL